MTRSADFLIPKKPKAKVRTNTAKIARQLRAAVADLLDSAGCDCCRDTDSWNKHQATLAKLLRVPKYKDGSGFDFSRFSTRTKESKNAK